MITARRAAASEFALAAEVYRQTGYTGGIAPGDEVYLAAEGDRIVGVVRLCSEFGTTVLRGCYILTEFQRRGAGTLLLRELEGSLARGVCYCIPGRHLEKFYALAAFEKIDDEKAPLGLRKRLDEYRSIGKDVIVMRRRARP